MKTKTFIKMIVHPGTFHADDVLCVVMAKFFGILSGNVERRVPTDADIDDPAILVADIGGIHDPEKGNFDHHQNKELPAACWLLADWLDILRLRPVKDLIAEISDGDTGRRHNGASSLSMIIHSLNLPGCDLDKAFKAAAYDIMYAAFEAVYNYAIAEEAARSYVLDAPVCGRVLVLDKFVQWANHIFDRPDFGDILYVIYPSPRGGWCLQQVPASKDDPFKGKKPLPKEWAGKRGELADYIGVAAGDNVFCHAGRFIGGAMTKDDVMKMASIAVKA